ncbi:DNA-binding transcriptional MerR regulator [Paraburkholderia youngii]|uniref:MerR family transcriptional regulator n=1 Tax=Paraburkholderia youngii TaxID=2782701 RepID=A0ABX2NQP9_9BURK|nr:MerR family transcriptional regulator [Paraburkholderia youngii]NUX56784.1 MerR family transcriptional regulator [Paraburkholderia youngii]NVI06769.1 MerR family transcriptional regulator [Paraburkholderia youngii]
MTATIEKVVLPPIPAKRYFTIGEVSELCGVKPHVLRYWEQEFTQLRPVKRRGNRRYYQHHEVLLIRRIRELLYEQGFTINGARNRLDSHSSGGPDAVIEEGEAAAGAAGQVQASAATVAVDVEKLREELQSVIDLLGH